MELSELVKLVAENPDVVDPFLVYADHLQETGDPRGELITLELMRLEDPHDEERVRAVARHLDRHRRELLGPLVDLSACLSDEKWHLGFLRRVTLQHPEAAPPDELAFWVKLLFDAPSSAFLRELTVTPLLYGDYTPLIHVLARRGSNLRALRIGPGQASSSLDLGDLTPGLAGLESLAVAAHQVNLLMLRLPKLAELDLWVDALTHEHLRSLAVAELPSLGSLSIAFSRGSVADLPRYVVGSLPQLERLRVAAASPAELAGFVVELSRSALARRLTSLTIDGASFEDVMRLVDASAAFESLERLVVGSRPDTDELLDRFRARGVEVTSRLSWMDFDPWDEITDLDYREG